MNWDETPSYMSNMGATQKIPARHQSTAIKQSAVDYIKDLKLHQRVGQQTTTTTSNASSSSGISDLIANYDWEAFDQIPNVTADIYEQCLGRVSNFINIFSDVSNIPVDKYDDVLMIISHLNTLPQTAEGQKEYVGKLALLAEIIGNEEIITCIDAIKSYEYDAQLAASANAAANGNSNGNGNGNGNGGNNSGDLPRVGDEKPSLIYRMLNPWYGKVAAVMLLTGGAYGTYRFFTRKKKKDDDDVEDDDEMYEPKLEEGEVWVPKDFGQPKPSQRKVKRTLNPRKKKKVRISRKKKK